jgi:hypothetical protein
MPHGSMAIPTNKAFVALGMGAALTMVTLLACLICADLREGHTLSLQELGRGETTLMSCARDDNATGSGELLWCGDASSPLCLPALPATGQVDLGEGPLAVLLTPNLAQRPPTFTWLTWKRPSPARTPVSRVPERLERPPRA